MADPSWHFVSGEKEFVFILIRTLQELIEFCFPKLKGTLGTRSQLKRSGLRLVPALQHRGHRSLHHASSNHCSILKLRRQTNARNVEENVRTTSDFMDAGGQLAILVDLHCLCHCPRIMPWAYSDVDLRLNWAGLRWLGEVGWMTRLGWTGLA